MSVHVQRFVIVRGPDGKECRMETTNCWWCGDWPEHLCSVCADRAKNLRRALKSEPSVVDNGCGSTEP